MREYTVTLRREEPPSPKSRLDRLLQIAQIVSLLALPLIVAIGGWLIQGSVATAQVEQKYVELALSILREAPQDSDKSLRQWSTQTLAKYSKVPFTSEDLRRLSEGSVVLPKGSGASFSLGPVSFGGGTSDPNETARPKK